LDANKKVRAKIDVAHAVNKVTGAKTTTEPSTITLSDAKGNVIYQKP
jgi:hypothetical protein